MTRAMTPPHNLDAEAAVIGSVLLDPAVFDDVGLVLGPRDFYAERNGVIWGALAAVLERGEGLDTVTLQHELERRGKLTGELHDYILQLTATIPTAANAGDHARIVRDAALARRMIIAAHRVAAEGYAAQDVASYVDRSEALVLAISQDRGADETSAPISSVVQAVFERLRHVAEHGSDGIPTGFESVDHKTSGMFAGELHVIAGRPGMGKTAYALNVARNVAGSTGPVAIFSLEMPKEQLVRRLLASEARVNGARLKSGQLSAEDWSRIGRAAKALHALPIEIDDKAGLTPLQLRARARRLRVKLGGLALVVVDYLQLMRPDQRQGSRERDVAEMSASAKELARELQCPVMMLSQLNREVDKRQGHRPTLSDLRDSGAVEQDADVVGFVFRPCVYDRKADPTRAELILAKQRDGSTGRAPLAYFEEYTRFESVAIDDADIDPADFQDEPAPRRGLYDRWLKGARG